MTLVVRFLDCSGTPTPEDPPLVDGSGALERILREASAPGQRCLPFIRAPYVALFAYPAREQLLRELSGATSFAATGQEADELRRLTRMAAHLDLHFEIQFYFT